MRKMMIPVLLTMLFLLVLPGCGTEDAISITDYEWIYSHTRTANGVVIYCNGTAFKQFPDATPYTVTLTPAAEIPQGTELGYEILYINQYTGERMSNIYGFTLVEADPETAVYSVNISGGPNDVGQAVVSKTVEGNTATPTLTLTTPNGTDTFLSTAVTITPN